MREQRRGHDDQRTNDHDDSPLRSGGGEAFLAEQVDEVSVPADHEHHGFTPIPENPNRLVQKMSDIAGALDA